MVRECNVVGVGWDAVTGTCDWWGKIDDGKEQLSEGWVVFETGLDWWEGDVEEEFCAPTVEVGMDAEHNTTWDTLLLGAINDWGTKLAGDTDDGTDKKGKLRLEEMLVDCEKGGTSEWRKLCTKGKSSSLKVTLGVIKILPLGT